MVRCLAKLAKGQVAVYMDDKQIDDGPQLGVLLRLASQQWTSAVEAALDDAGLDGIRPPHANVFTFVSEHGSTVSELTKRAHVRKQTMTQAVEELEALGYVERRPDPRDRRARLVVLTPRGRRVQPLAMRAGAQVEARWQQAAGAEEINRLRAGLAELLAALEDDAPPRDGA